MRILFTALSLCFLLYISITSQQSYNYPLRSAALNSVKLTTGFWLDRFEINKTSTLPHIIKKCWETGRVNNLIYAAGLRQGEFCTVYPFDDSDVYKTIEAVSYSLISYPDIELEKQIDCLITILGLAQEEDGYLYSARSSPSDKIKKSIGTERWSNLQWSHELYNLGHLYEAAVAHNQATGKNSLLNIALKNAELVINTFNTNGLQIPPGHEEIEIGLVKLYELTGDKRFLNQAKYFLDIRGRGTELTGRESWGEYAQDHKPVTEQNEAVGHAVRAAYLYSAMTDVVAYTGDNEYKQALNNLWKNIVTKKMYITGGIGSTGSGEALGDNYDLPNASAYNETCSSIANMMWNYKMFLLYADAKYLDVFERTLFNAFLSGVGMDGKSFFYPNPLQSFGTHERSPWFTCACCPPNVARFIASLPEKFYSFSDDEIYVNLYSSNMSILKLGSEEISIFQETNYPWDGNIKLHIQPHNTKKKFSLKLRIPGWSINKPIEGDLYSFAKSEQVPVIKLNGKEQPLNLVKGFFEIEREWDKDDLVELILPMEINYVVANENVTVDRGKIALQRGPIVYCAEGVDQHNGYVRNILLPNNTKLDSKFEPGLLNGVEVIKGKAFGYSYNTDNNLIFAEQDFTAVPYYTWSHRGMTEMSVWIANREDAVLPLHGPTLISSSKISVSSGKNFKTINDQIEPINSSDESVPFYHWWPNKGTKEFVQIDFPETSEVSQVEIYWFDDEGQGECRIPNAWNIKYQENDKWINVYPTHKSDIEKDKYNSIIFETVRTNSLRIEIESQKDFAGGIHEIKIK
mgnify:CR=1 FL=1